MTASQIARTLHGVKAGKRWSCRCPVPTHAHGDRNRSLSVWNSDDGWTCFKCHVGHDRMEILSAMGLSLRDIGPDGQKREWTLPASVAKIFKEAGPAIKKPLGPVEATYRYTDARGELVAEKQRREGKVFLWRRPQVGGGWAWKLDRESLPLYRLHDVIKSAVVVLVEGEKDADNVAKLGICATTAPNGAKSWKPEYAQFFAGKKVFIIPDSDKPGVAYAEVAGQQIAEFAQFVRIVSVWPAKDVSDYLASHSPFELSVLLKSKPLVRLGYCDWQKQHHRDFSRTR